MSLRTRLVTALCLIAALLVVAAVVVTRTTSDHLIEQVDVQLERIRGPGEPGRAGGSPPPAEPGTSLGGSTDRPGADSGSEPGSESAGVNTLYVGTFADGTLETRISPDLPDAEKVHPSISEELARSHASGKPFTVPSNLDGVRYRVTIREDSTTGSLTVLGMQLNDVDSALHRLLLVEVITTCAVLLFLALIVWWVIRLGVRPIKAMTEAATTIASGDLTHRITVPAPGTEAGELGAALNTMMQQIESSFEEQRNSEARVRRFVADASHELRTPITTIRGYAELFRLGALSNPDDLDSAMERTEAEAIRMGSLVNEMLTLTRLDQGEGPPPVPVALDRVVREASIDATALNADREITVEIQPAVVMGNHDQLQQVVMNLLRNALVHTPSGAPIHIELVVDSTDAVLTIRDEGPGMDPETVEHAFERFFRGDASRSRQSGSTGLGLAIVAAIIESHQGTVTLETKLSTDVAAGEVSGTSVTVRLPLQSQPA